MDGKRFIRTIHLRNFLSYGDASKEFELLPLNVLIGPNCSGKSNLIEAISILRATPSNLTSPIREGGGISEWLWKGSPTTPTAEIDVTTYYPEGLMPLRYRLAFTMTGQRMELLDEAIENERPQYNEQDAYFFYRYQHGRPVLNVKKPIEPMQFEPPPTPGYQERTRRTLRREDLSADQSVLSQRKDPDQYPEITYLGNQVGKLRLYREWNLGRYTPPRLPQKPDLPEDFLSEDATNLGLVLNDLQHYTETKRLLLTHLIKLDGAIEDVTTRIHGGTVQIFVHEKGLHNPIPATRLSDGTLRYLCLLVVLCHPSPPPLICIEEPELSLHPDILESLAELMLDASKRTQLVVTTHSDVLVSALTEVPESVMVCARGEEGTQVRRLDSAELKDWLERYRLGELWRMGEIGGTRW